MAGEEGAKAPTDGRALDVVARDLLHLAGRDVGGKVGGVACLVFDGGRQCGIVRCRKILGAIGSGDGHGGRNLDVGGVGIHGVGICGVDIGGIGIIGIRGIDICGIEIYGIRICNIRSINCSSIRSRGIDTGTVVRGIEPIAPLC